MDIEQVRKKIDEINDEMLELFLKRMDLSEKIANIKKDENKPLRDKIREREILDKVVEKSDKNAIYAKNFFNNLMSLSRTKQLSTIGQSLEFSEKIEKAKQIANDGFPQKAYIAVQGVQGSWSQIATDKMFSLGTIMYFDKEDDVLDAVSSGMCEFGVIPIENSQIGTVRETYQKISQKKLYIVKSLKQNIDHKLMGIKGADLSDLKEIHAHKNAISQCTSFIETLGDIKIVLSDNTALSAKYIKEENDKSKMAICSKNAGELYGLETIKEHIANSEKNYTKFICITKDFKIYPGSNKISLTFSLLHTTGSLADILTRLSYVGLNINLIETIMLDDLNLEYVFFVEVDGSLEQREVSALFNELQIELPHFEILGNYIQQ